MGRVREGVAVIGAGNWGSSLAAGVVAAGIPLLEVVVRGAPKQGAKFSDRAAVTWETAKLDARVIWLCVPDGQIAAVSARIAARRSDLRGQLAVHSSGALTIAALEAVSKSGAGVGGIAPVFSFPTRVPVPLRNVMFAVEPGPGQSRNMAALVRRLGGKPLRLSSENKGLYHAAATMASPLLVSELQAAVTTAELAGLSSREAHAVVGVLATATLRNFMTRSPERSFSGAFARGDAETVELHLRTLLKHPNLRGVYLALARNAVQSLPVRNRPRLERVLASPVSKRRVRD